MMKLKFIVLISLLFFTSCSKEKKDIVDVKDVKNYTQVGKNYAMSTKKILGKNLKQAITKNGTIGALSFCNEKAMSLTHEMELKYDAIIRRVSDKNRNPKNKANSEELKYIETFKKMLANGEKIKPIIKKNNGNIYFYAPIKTDGLCLQCHGNLTKEVHLKIKQLYPNDLAVGYKENQIRGVWSISFKK